jgi:predicted deacylase
LTEAGFDVLPVGAPNACEVIVSEAELEALWRCGLVPEVLAEGQPFRDLQARELSIQAVPAGYPELEQILAQLHAAEDDFPALCKVVDLTETYGTAPTFEGRHLFALKISARVAQEEDEPTFLLVGAHHAREIVTPVIALYAVEQLTQRYGIDPNITALVDAYEIWVAPVWNPDGYEHVFRADNFWRKNRRVFSPGDGVGVDLNRNYPVGWDAGCGGGTVPTSETYRGPEPASEAETQTMVAFGRDRRFAKVADLHSAAREVRYASGCLFHPFLAFLSSEAAVLAVRADYGTALSCCAGGDIHFHTANYGSHAFLWETHSSFQPSYASARKEAARVLPSVLALLQRPVSLCGHVTDALTGKPVAATLICVGVPFAHGETNGSDERWGRYHAFLPDGVHLLEFTAAGYHPRYYRIKVDSAGSQVLDVPMMPVNGEGSPAPRNALGDPGLTAGDFRL